MNILNYSRFNDFLNCFNVYSNDFSYIQVGQEWDFRGVTSPFNRLYFITSGHAFVRCGSRRVDLLPGHAYLLPASQTFDYICEGSMEKFYHHFNLLLPDGHDLFEGVPECLELPCPVTDMYEALKLPGTVTAENILQYRLFLCSILLQFVQIAEKRGYSFEFPQYPPLIMQCLWYIRTQLSARLSLADCAAYLHLSPSALTKQFRTHLGVTVSAYIHNALMQQARQLLFTEQSIKEISTSLQFRDPYYFSRFFSRHEGCSPSAYRKKNAMDLHRYSL